MRDCNRGRFRQQIKFLQRQFLQDGELPFSNLLSSEIVAQALKAVGAVWNDRIYTPLVTLWVFLNQVLSADHSCRAAVARLIAHRMSCGLQPCSPETGAYCQARRRLSEKFFSMIALHVGRLLDSRVDSEWLWKGRRVYMFDGTTVTMPDTAANQEAYPQIPSQRPGLGSPIARIGAIMSLSCGAIVGAGFRRFAGKGQGELNVLRQLWDLLSPGDVLLGDRLLCSWREMTMLKLRGVDTVTRICRRTADFRRGKRLGKEDHIVRWPKPAHRTGDKEEYKALPDYFEFRETRVHIKQQGFRTKSIVVVTTLLDAKQTPKEELASLYLARWNNELDLRSIKSTMQMDDLRCKTPELVRKEIWTHVLAYNLVRTMMAQAATKYKLEPRSISFKGTIQTLEAFQPVIALKGRSASEFLNKLFNRLLECIAAHKVAKRPNRFEPRKRKRRFKLYNFLRKSRQETKLDMMKRVRKN